ncbi:protein kinase [Streptomyces netropsis]|uniref:non-specific serine/threonine protein kinase n=2 Tax=Streptomyces netropsis TaxID=55404 RepID=A0A7W7LEL2_STRNE|nr:serine/threonine-protein kinase [Streptomyces netropsis]MBB4888762.1 serine/threonine protein kinase [Streptomyces netropsis]
MSDSVSGAASGWPAAAGSRPDRGLLIAGRYRLLERVGRGGMGTVWRAEDELLDRQVALKQLHVSPYLEEDELATLYERTRREARSAARINHPNVVVVHDVVEHDGLPCIVMEYVPSTTLGDVIRQGTVSPDEAARIGRGMIAALRAAHAAGVLHRDVKPGNVLLGEDGRVVLTDFGIAQSTGTSTLTKTGEMVGSIDYIAPERVKGAKPGPASDLWALGATLYQALEGRPPFRKDTAVETAYAIAMDPLEPPLRAGPLTRLIETLLAKEPDLRPPAELAEQILREPVAEVETAYLRIPERRTESTTVTAGAPTAVEPSGREESAEPSGPAEPSGSDGTAETSGSVAPSRASGAVGERTAGAEREGGRRRARTLLWGATATVVAAGLAAGAFFMTRDAGDGQDTDPRAAAPENVERHTGRPAEPSPAAWKPPPVPAGYHLVEEKQLGVSFPVPNGWTRKEKSPVEVDYIAPGGLVGIKVNVLDFASPDHLRHWKEVEEQLKTEVDGYRLGRMQETKFRGEPAAVWEFTFKGRVREFRAIDLGFGREGGNEYALYLSAPKDEWNRHVSVFHALRDGFRPGPDGPGS